MTRRCCGRCRAIPGTCGDHACQCHRATRDAQRAADLGESLADATEAARDQRIGLTENKRRAILAAQIGIDGPAEVARAYQVPVGAVRAIWRKE